MITLEDILQVIDYNSIKQVTFKGMDDDKRIASFNINFMLRVQSNTRCTQKRRW